MSAKAPETGEVIDLSEYGACIQTSAALQLDSKITLSLDLLETEAFLSSSGVVVWSDERGRNGIQFQEISDDTRAQLRSWLSYKATGTDGPSRGTVIDEPTHRPIRSTVTRSRRESPAREFVKQSPEQTRAAIADTSIVGPAYSSTGNATTLARLVELKREVEEISDLDVVLKLLAARALALTGATGAAIALARYKSADEMICRARAGSDAPGLGAKLQVGSGFSGQCVRTGKALRCDDAETDPRVDREGCRVLGIRSMIASPIRRDDFVAGILEVFSPAADSFSPTEEKILERIAEMVAGAIDRAAREVTPGVRTAGTGHELNVASPSALSATHSATSAATAKPQFHRLDDGFLMEHLAQKDRSPFRNIFLIVATVGVIVGLLWFFSRLGSRKDQSVSHSLPAAVTGESSKPPVTSKSADFESLRNLAVNGDPDAQFDIGARYATGEDVKQDYSEAIRWFTQAAEQGHVIAQATLGAYYWAGRGVPQDLSKAYFWSAIAEAGGDSASKYRVEVLASRMSHSDVAAVGQQANAWLKKHQVAAQTSK
jgi:GAF domain-containing protein